MITNFRRARGWTQSHLAQLLGISRFHLIRLEAGMVLPSPELAERMEGLLESRPLVCSADLVPTHRMGLRLFDFPPVSDDVWRRALEDWEYPISRLGLAKRLLGWMRSHLGPESTFEAYTLLHLAALEGASQVSSPHALGFRHLPIVDRDGQVLGERLLPGLTGRVEGVPFWVWPQVSFRVGRAPYRVDGLVLFRPPARGAVWATKEVDGPGHNPDGDDFRQARIGLPVIRIGEREVREHRAGASFVRQAAALLGL